MRSRNEEKRQLGAWLLAGLSAPLAQFACGMSWQTVTLVALICLPVCWLVSRVTVVTVKWINIAELVWLACVLSALGRWMSESWPSGNTFPAVPLTLLALGAVSAARGPEQAARGGSVVFWLTALLYSVVVAAGLSQVEWEELTEFNGRVDFRLAVILLLPAVTVFLQRDKKGLPLGSVMGVGAFAVLVSILVTGALSLRIAQNVEKPLHEWVAGLSLAGTLQRFEALASVALTMGWFALASYALCIAGTLTDQIKEGCYGKGVWFVAAAAGILMLAKVAFSSEMIVIGSVLLWIIVPLVMSAMGKNKKFKIHENNA